MDVQQGGVEEVPHSHTRTEQRICCTAHNLTKEFYGGNMRGTFFKKEKLKKVHGS